MSGLYISTTIAIIAVACCFPGCFPYVVAADFSCTFDNLTDHLCGLANNGNKLWRHHSGSTSSIQTGPEGDHTSGSGYYMYIESSSPNYPLVGPFFLEKDNFANGVGTVMFWYSMNGPGCGTLSLDKYKGTSSSWSAVWDKVGDQGSEWQQAIVVLNDPAVTAVRFAATTAYDFTGDIAIDDVVVATYWASPSPSITPGPSSSPVPTRAPFAPTHVTSTLQAQEAIDSGAPLVSLANDILLERTIRVVGNFVITLQGNGHALNGGYPGQGSVRSGVRCLYISGTQISTVVTLVDVILKGGFAKASIGGGLLVSGGARVYMVNVQIVENLAVSGAGMFVHESFISLQDSVVSRNGGNGIMCYASEGIIVNTTVSANLGGSSGGGLNMDGCSISISNSTFSGNTALRGGGIYASNSAILIMMRSFVSYNIVSAAGGGIFLDRASHANISHSVIHRNIAERNPFKLVQNPSVPFCFVAGGCIFSPGFPGPYPNNQKCVFHVVDDVNLEVINFDMEQTNDGSIPTDYLQINFWKQDCPASTKYSGSIGPDAVAVLKNSTIEFHSNYATTSIGFQICSGSNGGAVFMNNAAVTMRQTVVTDNSATSRGGGFHLERNSVLDAMSVEVRGNSAGLAGAGLYLDESNVQLVVSSVEENVIQTEDLVGGGYPGHAAYVASGAFTGSNINIDADIGGPFSKNSKCTSTCAAGSYSHCTMVKGTDACFANCGVCRGCPTGKASSSVSATSESVCIPCGPGLSAQAEGSTYCSKCAEGRFAASGVGDVSGGVKTQVTSGSPICNACPAGRFNSIKSSIMCQQCPSKTSSSVGAVKCELAAPGYYLEAGYPAVLNFSKCPANAVCRGDVYTPRPKKGYWVKRDRALEYLGEIYSCPRPTCDPEHHNSDEDMCWTQSANLDPSFACDSDDLQCTPGSTGPLCGSCKKGLILSRLKCTECSGEAIIYVAAAAATLSIAAVAYFMRALGFKLPLCVKKHWLMQAIDSGTLRTVWSTYQIVASIRWAVDVTFPEPFNGFERALSVFSFDVLSVDCLYAAHDQSRFEMTTLTWALGPVVFFLVNLLVYFLRVQLNSGDLSAIKQQHSFNWIFFAYLVLPPVMLKLLQALDCTSPVAGNTYLRVDTSVDCGSSKYRAFAIADVLLVVVYLSVPLQWFVLLFQHKSKMNPWSSNEAQSFYQRNSDESISHLRFLFKDYRIACYAWEPFELTRRLFFIGAFPLLSRVPSERALFGVLCAATSAVVYREMEPFAKPTTNHLAMVAQFSIFFTFGIALAIEIGLTHDLSTSLFIGVFLVIVNLGVFTIALGTGLLRALERRSWKTANPLSTQELSVVEGIMNKFDGEMDSAAGGRAESEAGFAFAIQQAAIRPQDIILIKKVGAGAFGEVYFASCLGQEVAVKTLRVVNEESVREFRHEIMLHSALRHPNICNFVGGTWGRELMGLVIEWVPSGSLADLLKVQAREVAWEEPMLKLATDIARGMAYLHGRSYYDERTGALKTCIVHRDLKPDNVLITTYSSAKIADFGASRTKPEDGVQLTVVGTPIFAAPEAMRGEPYDQSVDVYSFGCVLMEMAADEGLVDFLCRRWAEDFRQKAPNMSGIESRRVLISVWDKGWRPITSDPNDPHLLPGAPATVHALAVRCCAHDPALRPSFSAVLDELLGPATREVGLASFPRRPPRSSSHRESSSHRTFSRALSTAVLSVGRRVVSVDAGRKSRTLEVELTHTSISLANPRAENPLLISAPAGASKESSSDTERRKSDSRLRFSQTFRSEVRQKSTDVFRAEVRQKSTDVEFRTKPSAVVEF